MNLTNDELSAPQFAQPQIPRTTNPELDDALAKLADLGQADASQQLDMLSQAHEVIASVLDNSRNG